MKTIQQAMLEEIYTNAIEISRKENQVLHADGGHQRESYFITLHQLETILKSFEG